MKTDAELSELLREVISGNISRGLYMRAFQLIYHLCEIENSSEKVYRIVRSSLRNDVREKLKKIQECPDDESFLRTQRDEWKRYCELVTVLQRLLHFMDSRIASENLLEHEDWRALKSMAFGNWRENVLSHFEQRLIRSLIRASDLDRKGRPVLPDAELSTVLEVITRADETTDNLIQMYERYRNAYFSHLEELYWVNLSTNRTAMDIIRIAQKFMAEELPRARKFLRQDDEFITDNIQKFMFSNDPDFFSRTVAAAIAALDLTKLREFYGYLKSMKKYGERLLIQAMTASVQDNVAHLYEANTQTGKNSATVFVDIILTVEQNFRRIIEEAFDNDRLFDDLFLKICGDAVKKLEVFFKQSSAQLVAKFYDDVLNSARGSNVNGIEQRLELASKAAKYAISAEDFQATYIDLLRQRLSKDRWSNIEVENRAVDALGEIKGRNFTAPITRILTDIGGSKVVNQIFTNFLRTTGNYAGDFEVIIVSSEFWQWRASQSPLVRLPPGIENNLSAFEFVYPECIRRLNSQNKDSRNQAPTESEIAPAEIPRLRSRIEVADNEYRRPGSTPTGIGQRKPSRKFTWFHDRAQAEIEVNFESESRSYLVKCSAYTAIVLLLFEDDAPKSKSDVKKKTKLSDVDLQTALGNLEKAKLLKKDPVNGANYIFNLDFKSRTRVVNLLESTQEENSPKLEEPPMTEPDLKAYTEALLMRIFKKHRVLDLKKLIEVFRAQARSCLLERDGGRIVTCLKSLSEKLYVKNHENTYYYIP